MHRDFQSKNITIFKGEIYLLDFQDACLGPYTYDLVSLLEDPYVMLYRDTVSQLKDYYLQRMNELMFIKINPEDFEKDYNFSACSRLFQAIGAFSRLKENNKDEFEQYIEPAFSRLISLIDSEKFPVISNFLNEIATIIWK
mgnify:CR=1 FL=1